MDSGADVAMDSEADVAMDSERTVRVTQEHNEECRRLLRLMGVPIVEVCTARCCKRAEGLPCVLKYSECEQAGRSCVSSSLPDTKWRLLAGALRGKGAVHKTVQGGAGACRDLQRRPTRHGAGM